jgi:hypothetical protein
MESLRFSAVKQPTCEIYAWIKNEKGLFNENNSTKTIHPERLYNRVMLLFLIKIQPLIFN